MPANSAVHVMVVEGFADWEPAHALAELRRWANARCAASGSRSSRS